MRERKFAFGGKVLSLCVLLTTTTTLTATTTTTTTNYYADEKDEDARARASSIRDYLDPFPFHNLFGDTFLVFT